MKLHVIVILLLSLAGSFVVSPVHAESTRKERRLINRGNDLYKERKFVEAQSVYEEALKENATSAEARYNLGLSQIRQVVNPADSTPAARTLTEAARKNFADVAAMARTKPGLAAKANFNLGNIEFHVKDYQKAIDYYKQALRIDPSDDKARKNLRIAQKNLQKQNQDKNQNQDQNKDQDKDKKDNQDKNQDQQQNQNQNQNKDRDKQKDKQQNLSQQAASQILQAVDNKESQTRARVNRANKGEKSEAAGRNTRRW